MADEYLGRAIINIKDAAKNQITPNFFNENISDNVKNSIPKPDWYPIRFSNDESMPITGQILCSFVFVPGDSVFAPIRTQKIQQSIPRKDYVVDIQILCLRDLQSFGLMPVRKPFLRFNLKDLLPPEKMAGFSNIQTEPSSGANPNINTLLTFSMSLPEEDLYCPYLQVDVFDYIFLGLSQPLIGAFQISIGTEKDDSKKRNIAKLKNANDIIQNLQKNLNTSLQELKQQQLGRKQNYDPLVNQLVDRKLKKQSQSKGNSQQQVSNPQIKALMNDFRNRLVKNYQPQIDEENPIQFNFLQIPDNQPDQPIGFDKLQKEFEQLSNQQKLLEKQITDLQSPAKVKEQNLTDREVEIKIKELSTQLINVKINKNKVKEQLKSLDRKSDQIYLKNEHQKFSDILILPQYNLNAELNMYEEIDKPKESIYMSVGYNDYVNITKYITGNDLDKRLKQQIAQGEQVQLQIAEDQIISRKYQMSKMHYRKFYNQELESVKTIFTEQIFDEYKIFRGAQRGANHSIFSVQRGKVDESGQISNRKQVGMFKGLVDIFNVEERKKDNEVINQKLREIYNLLSQIYEKSYGQQLNISMDQLSTKQGASEFWLKMEDCYVDTKLIKAIYRDSISYEKVKKQLNQKFNCTCRLYILEGYDFASRDICSASDPYIKITCGSQVYDERDNFQLDQPNPKFFKSYSITTTFPCSPWILIQAFDHNDLFGDELIGSTKIDLDDRFFNQKWQELNEKPIEFRQLHHHSSSLSQGLISMWLEIDENVKQQNPKKVWPLDPEPIRDYQLRVCIYDTQNIPKMDIEGTSDVYITSYIYYKEKQSTDTHYRCMDGHASFNYRMTFDVKAPCSEFMLVLQAWDRDLLTRNEYICEWTIDLIQILKIVQLTQKTIHLKKTFYEKQKEKYFTNIELEFLDEDSFWLTVKREGKDIKIRLDVRLLPKFEAEACKVGMARTEPNIEPYLPPPVGRMIMSLNPCRMIDQLVSPQFKRKIMMFLCLAICLILVISMIPMITSNFFSSFMIWLITPTQKPTIIYQSQPTQASSNDVKSP